LTKIIGSAALTAADPTGENLIQKGDLHGYSSENTRIPISTNGYVLTADSAQALGLKWAASAGSANLTFIAEVNLGSANAVIEKNSGLDDYEVIVVDFVLRESGGDTFIPTITYYEDGAEITANYGFSETIDGAAIAKTDGASSILIDADSTANNQCQGRVIIYPHTGAANVMDCSYSILTGSSSSAPDAFATVWGQHDGGANRISGIKFTNIGAGSPTFSDESHLEIWGIKEI